MLERPGKRREEAHARHAAELVRRRRRWASAGRDGGAITMRGVEIAVDGGGGAMGGRMAGRPWQGREMGSVHLISYLLDFNERDIPHNTGIHKQVGEPKKVRKKFPPFVFRKR
jgi:hypothetical protein